MVRNIFSNYMKPKLLFIKVNRNYKTKDSTIYASMHCCILDNNCREENRNLSHTSFIRWTTTIRHARASLHACKQNHHDKLFLKLVGPMLQKENNSRFKLISSYIYIYIYSTLLLYPKYLFQNEDIIMCTYIFFWDFY